MQNRYRRLLLATIVSLSGVAGIAEHALALTFTEFPTATDSRPSGITTGPDGALWFTEYGTGQIGRITTAGMITEFPIPTAIVENLVTITQRQDAALWFIDTTDNQIDSITTAREITEFIITMNR